MDINPPFSEQEKRFVLAEAIKTSSIPVERVLAFLRDGNVQPAWTLMCLPNGRNLQSCMDTFEVLRTQPYQYPTLPLPNLSHKRKSAPEHLEPLMTAPQPKRRPSGAESLPSARDIRPKPTSSNGSPNPFSTFQSASPPVPSKKRGRPSKEDVEKRNREAIARGEVLPPPKAITPKGGKLPISGESSSAGYAAIAPMTSLPPLEPMRPQYQSGPGDIARAAPTTSEDTLDKKKRTRALPKPKAPNPGEGSFSVATPPISQPAEARQTPTPITPSQPVQQHQPARENMSIPLIAPPIQSAGQGPLQEPQARPDPPQPDPPPSGP